MRRKAFFLLLFSLWSASGAAWQATVLFCSDGDTCRVGSSKKSVRVRLIGIDAPEVRHGDEPGQPFGETSKDYLNGLVKGRSVEIRNYGKDEYGRILGVLTGRNGLDINEEMIRTGMAEVYRGRSSFDQMPLLKVQEIARKEKKGIWSQGESYESPFVFRKRMRGESKRTAF